MRTLKFIAALLSFSLAAGSAHAQAPETHAQLTLVAEEAAYQPGQQLWVGVLFHLDPGWHVYWQNPGDSGTPPKIQWIVPKGFRAGTVHWPRPIRLGKGTVIDYGYEGLLLLMTPFVSPLNSVGPAIFGADVNYVVCREICIPGKAQLSLTVAPLTGRTEHPSDASPLFQATRKQFPRPVPDTWQISAQASKNNFVLTVGGVASKPNTTFFPLDPGVIDNAAPQTLSAAGRSFTLTLAKSELLTRPPRTLHGVLDIPGTGTFEVAAPVSIATAAAPVAQGAR